ncbi:MAG TPA: DivIVA domain-containing protein [Deinococcales bacterium]|nr:DivIVA domain-containing protein [Deinococcales bacterium]
MNLTPLDIRHQEFAGALSGYSKREVREFLERLADQTEEAERDVRAARERIAQLEAQVLELREGEEMLRRAVVSAERIANEIKGNAEREAQLMRQEAEATRDKVMREALQRVRETRVDLDRARSDRQLFLDQFRALLQGYLASLDRLEDPGAPVSAPPAESR